ncbi:hypothetical protein EYZ11_011038 [Aspergillus tanneri]|uniref:Uncharacterized protein n=1 Tax=Aspergillus tanneri TaxID=1220188 RepID=A0A4S3J3U5_9EURO|nr:hypothetical protein EYZ11_011038 [Aspergillus tanneri]
MPPLLSSACPLADGHDEAFGPSFQVIADVTLEYADTNVPDQEIEFEFIMDYHEGICALGWKSVTVIYNGLLIGIILFVMS